MRTTLNIPDELMRAVKIMAAEQNRTIQDVISELLRKGLAFSPPNPDTRETVQLPLIQCVHSSEQVTPEFVAELLIEDEARDTLRH